MIITSISRIKKLISSLKNNSFWIGILLLISIVVFITIVVFLNTRLYSNMDARYEKAVELYHQGQYEEAYELFLSLGDHKDSQVQSEVARLRAENEAESLIKSDEDLKHELYIQATTLFDNEEYLEAARIFLRLGDYEDSANLFTIATDRLAAAPSDISSPEPEQHDTRIMLEPEDIDSVKLPVYTTISASTDFLAAIDKNGDLVTIKRHNREFVPVIIGEWNDLISVSCGYTLVIGLKEDGTVLVSGRRREHTAESREISNWRDIEPYFSQLTEIVQVAAGYDFVIALDNTGKLHLAGFTSRDLLKVEEWNDVKAFSVGSEFVAALLGNGDVVTTNEEINKQISENKEDWHNIIAISIGGGGTQDEAGGIYYNTGHIVGLRSDGRVIATGVNSLGQCNVGDWSNIVAISAGLWHTVAIDSSGNVLSVGGKDIEAFHSYHNRDIENWNLHNIVNIYAGWGFTIGIDDRGNAYMAGYQTGNLKQDVNELKNLLVVNNVS